MHFRDSSVAIACSVTPFNSHSQRTHLLMRELSQCIPNSEVRDRRKSDIKKIIPKAIELDYTDMIVVNEDHKEPSIHGNS